MHSQTSQALALWGLMRWQSHCFQSHVMLLDRTQVRQQLCLLRHWVQRAARLHGQVTT